MTCECSTTLPTRLRPARNLGMDDVFGEASLYTCAGCGRFWLRYHYEVEAFRGSGRWYLGAVEGSDAATLKAEGARAALEDLEWYYYGGSYFDGRVGRSSGPIMLNP